MKEAEIIFYSAPKGNVKVDIRFEEETFWLTHKKLAVLFNIDRFVITKHLQNIFKENELKENSVCANFAHTAKDDKTYQTNF